MIDQVFALSGADSYLGGLALILAPVTASIIYVLTMGRGKGR